MRKPKPPIDPVALIFVIVIVLIVVVFYEPSSTVGGFVR